MLIGLIAILLIVLVLPFFVKRVENNLEIFLFAMGLSATIISGTLSLDLVREILENKLLYFITAAVLVAGILFKMLQGKVHVYIHALLKKVPLRVFVFCVIVILGFLSSVITAIVAALLLVEIVSAMPVTRKEKIYIVILSCFSIGLGAVLTPIGEPLSTIVTSKLHADFWYLARLLGVYVVAGIVLMGILGVILTKDSASQLKHGKQHHQHAPKHETYQEIIFRTLKIFLFVIALELLGAGFRPLIDIYIVHLDGRLLYFINMISAVLDNATLAAAEVSSKMVAGQIEAVLLGLLISGGMLIPGNIPNIISAHKLKIKSQEWAKVGIPVGLSLMLIFFVVIFIF